MIAWSRFTLLTVPTVFFPQNTNNVQFYWRQMWCLAGLWWWKCCSVLMLKTCVMWKAMMQVWPESNNPIWMGSTCVTRPGSYVCLLSEICIKVFSHGNTGMLTFLHWKILSTADAVGKVISYHYKLQCWPDSGARGNVEDYQSYLYQT